MVRRRRRQCAGFRDGFRDGWVGVGSMLGVGVRLVLKDGGCAFFSVLTSWIEAE